MLREWPNERKTASAAAIDRSIRLDELDALARNSCRGISGNRSAAVLEWRIIDAPRVSSRHRSIQRRQKWQSPSKIMSGLGGGLAEAVHQASSMSAAVSDLRSGFQSLLKVRRS